MRHSDIFRTDRFQLILLLNQDLQLMRTAVLSKFTQYEELRMLLLSTGERKIVEHTTNDSYWGDGGDNSGKNMLGRILMEIRSQLREQANNNT